MNEQQVLEIANQSIWTLMKMAVPVMLVALLVGLAISLFQALTQIQEMTLSFVPKIIAVFLCLILVMPFMINQLNVLSGQLMERVIEIEAPSGPESPSGELGE